MNQGGFKSPTCWQIPFQRFRGEPLRRRGDEGSSGQESVRSKSKVACQSSGMFPGDFPLPVENHGTKSQGATENAVEVAFGQLVFINQLFEKMERVGVFSS